MYSVAQFSLVSGSSRGFRSLSPRFVVFIRGEIDLSSLPCFGGAAVQISLKIGECCVAGVISSRMMQFGPQSMYRILYEKHNSNSDSDGTTITKTLDCQQHRPHNIHRDTIRPHRL